MPEAEVGGNESLEADQVDRAEDAVAPGGGPGKEAGARVSRTRSGPRTWSPSSPWPRA